jgi:hypothetical protein
MFIIKGFITQLICISQDEYVEKSDLQINNNEEINSWDILVDRGVYIFPIALVIPKSLFLICITIALGYIRAFFIKSICLTFRQVN